MFRRINLSAIVVMAIGCVLGYAVAAGNLNRASWAGTRQASSNSAAEQGASAQERQGGCSDGMNKGELVALATHNEKVAAEAEKSGKQPNILVVWGAVKRIRSRRAAIACPA